MFFSLVACGLVACVARMDDNSLEAVELSGGPPFEEGESAEITGVLAVEAGAEDGDWTLAIDETEWAYHSPSRVDLSALAGETVTVTSQDNFSAAPALVLADAAGPRFVETSGDDGTFAFGRPVWKLGDVLGAGVVVHLEQVHERAQEVEFTDVVVTTDDGEVRLLPGAPATVTIDGGAWRFTVLTAYHAVNDPRLKCGGAPDMLAVELLRTDAEPGPALVRPVGWYAPVGSCGG